MPKRDKKYRYVGPLEADVREKFPLICEVCGREISEFSPAFLYFDMGPGDFFLTDTDCAGRVDLADDRVVRKDVAQKR